MGGKVNNSISKKERIRNEKEKKKINSIYNLPYLFCCSISVI